ncbi:hypothetical protein DPMN_038859 [Dreissena polymorpha]|uniref:Uncharacterized protein n=1 Tax=Dreissena polymorpha TaxID=45954 RepID=A0A9D4MG95_DREPO|nr:hypothetical protein DPMN_038859 [Dreissena polymorpha]
MWPLEKNAPPLGSHVFQANIIIFELIQDILETNLLTKFHEDWTMNVASKVLTRKNAPPLTNLLTKIHDEQKINVTSRVLTRFYYSHIWKNAPPPWWQYVIGMNLLTEFHEDQTINVASRVKNAPPLGSHVFQANVIIFQLIQDINNTNLLTKFHEDWTINVASRVLTRKNAPPPDGHVYIIGTNHLTKFHEDWKINVASRVLTSFYKSHTVQPKRNKRISRSAAARRTESMPRQSLKPLQYVAASRISPRNFASVRRGMLRSAT